MFTLIFPLKWCYPVFLIPPMSPRSIQRNMSSQTITIIPFGLSTGLDYPGNLLVLIPIILFFMSLKRLKLIHLSVFSCPFLSGLSMHGTQLSSQTQVLPEEDRESGIGSTLDLSSSFESYNQHTNHHANTPSHQEAGRLSEEKGTRLA